MTTSPPNPAVGRLRERLNILVLVVPGQFLSLVAVYWLRFVPALRPFGFEVPAPRPRVFLAGAAVLIVPFLLPRAWFRPRRFERGGLYPALGVRLFRMVATDGDWVNSRLRRVDPAYRVVRDRRTRDDHIAGSITNERWHSMWLLVGLATAGSAVATHQFGWAIAVTLFNAAFNLYPVMHQRYKRARIRLPRAAEPAATSSAPASP